MVKADGSLLIQTKAPGSKVLKCLKHYDFEAFHELELAQRKDLDYPPYSKMVLFTVLGKLNGAVTADVWRTVRDIKDSAVTILGPVEVPSKSKSYEQSHQILLKSRDNKRLHEMAKSLLRNLEADRKIKVIVTGQRELAQYRPAMLFPDYRLRQALTDSRQELTLLLSNRQVYYLLQSHVQQRL